MAERPQFGAVDRRQVSAVHGSGSQFSKSLELRRLVAGTHGGISEVLGREAARLVSTAW